MALVLSKGTGQVAPRNALSPEQSGTERLAALDEDQGHLGLRGEPS